MTKVAIVNQHTSNFGDEAAGLAVLREVIDLLNPDQVDVFYFRHGNAGALQNDENRVVHHFLTLLEGKHGAGRVIARELLRKWILGKSKNTDLQILLEICKTSDFVLVSPAGANIGVYKDWSYLLTLLALVTSGVTPVFMQNTIGASGSWLFDKIALHVLRRSQISVRELRSQLWLRTKGLSAHLGVDSAILLDPLKNEATTDPYIAVVPTRLTNWHRSFQSQAGSINWPVALSEAIAGSAQGAQLPIKIVPHLYGPLAETAYLEEVCLDLRSRGASVEIVEATELNDYRLALAEATLVISMRYHGLILSANEGVPCITISYENKMVEAAAYFGLQELCVDVTQLEVADLCNKIRLALNERESLREKLIDRREKLKKIAGGALQSVKATEVRTKCYSGSAKRY